MLPTFTLALGAIAGYSRYQRNAMLDVLGQDFIRTARAKGLTRRQALFKHGLRTALIPMATLFAYGVAGLVTGAVFTEKIFGWHGMGEWLVQGIATQDTNIVAAVTVFTGVDDPAGRTAVRRHLRRARPEGAGVMTEPVTTDVATTAKSGLARRTRSRRGAPWCCAGSCATGPPSRRWSCSLLLFVGCYALPPLLPYNYTDLDYYALQQPPSTDALVRHQRARPGPARADAARHAEVDADRRLRGAHLDRHRRDGRVDRRLLRRLARPRADVDRRPAAGGARASS